MRRYSLLLLVLIILILNTVMQQFAYANPLVHPDMWALRHALPAGVAAAALCLAALGMGAQVWRGILPLCSTDWSPRRAWSYMSVLGMWCGWIPLLCALAYYPEAGSGPSRWLIGCFVALIAASMLNTLYRQKLVGLLCGLITAAAAIICGQMLWVDTPLDVLVVGLAAAPALELLRERTPARQLVWLMSAALFFCAYTAAFGYMTAFFPPGEVAPVSPWSMWMAVVFALVGLAFVIFAMLRRTLWGRRVVSLLGLLALAVWLWLHFAAALAPGEQWAALGFYVSALALLALPAGLLLRGLR